MVREVLATCPPIYLIDISMSGAEMNRHGWIRGTVYVNLAQGPFEDEDDNQVVNVQRYVFDLIASEDLFAVDLNNKHYYNFEEEDQNAHLKPSVSDIEGFESAEHITYDNAQPVIDHIADLAMADPDPENHRDYRDWEAIVFQHGEFEIYYKETDGGADAVAAVWESFSAAW